MNNRAALNLPNAPPLRAVRYVRMVEHYYTTAKASTAKTTDHLTDGEKHLTLWGHGTCQNMVQVSHTIRF